MRKKFLLLSAAFIAALLTACHITSESQKDSEVSSKSAEVGQDKEEQVYLCGMNYSLFASVFNEDKNKIEYERQEQHVFDLNNIPLETYLGCTVSIVKGYNNEGSIYIFAMNDGMFFPTECEGVRDCVIELPYIHESRIVKELLLYPEYYNTSGVLSFNLYLCRNSLTDRFEDFNDNMVLSSSLYSYKSDRTKEQGKEDEIKKCTSYVDLSNVISEIENYNDGFGNEENILISQISVDGKWHMEEESFLLEGPTNCYYICSLGTGKYRVAFLLDNKPFYGVFDGKTYLDVEFKSNEKVAVCELDTSLFPKDGELHMIRILVTELDSMTTMNYGMQEIR